jgi:hypothetical protein
MRSHTGGAISFGGGRILCKSSKQKLNTRSSTKAKFVGASDYLPNTIWVKNFLEAQGYTISKSIFEQDNESAIRLEKNGHTSAGLKSRHIDVRYFWMKDRIKAEAINIQHCPILLMVGDFFTKSLQGHLFRKFATRSWETIIWITSPSASLCQSRSVLRKLCNRATAIQMARIAMTVTVQHCNRPWLGVTSERKWESVWTAGKGVVAICFGRSFFRNNPVILIELD